MEFKQKNTKIIFLVFAFIFIVVYLLCANFLQLKSYNLMQKLTVSNRVASDDIVLIAIDDKSLRDIGRWPWKREYYLEIFDYLENHTNVKLMGYDGLVSAPDIEHSKSDKKFFDNIKKFKKLTVGIAFSNNKFEKDIDESLYELLLKEKSNIKIIDKRSKKNKITSSFQSFTALLEQYFKNVDSVGFVNVPEDVDGYVRKTAYLINYKNKFYPSLSLLMYKKYTGIDEYILTDSYLYGFSDDYTLKAPIKSDRGLISSYLSYYKINNDVYSHKKYSASDIINSYRAIKQNKKPSIDPKEFDNKIVLIGAYAQAQALADVVRTPISETFSGLDVQATSLDNLYSNNYFKTTSEIYNILICILIFILIFAIVNIMPIVNALMSSVCIAFAYILFTLFMYYNRISNSLILPELFILIALVCGYSYKYFIEDNKKRKIQKAMGKYLSYDVMQNVVENIDNIKLGGKKSDVSILFADIRNFTAISEGMNANSVSEILNEYFSAMIPVIEEYGGILNKFMGDAVLVIFGEKGTRNHALDAVKCGCKMLKKVKILQEKWLDEGKPKIEIGIGISSGEAFIGNIGSQDRLEYTVIGDIVNTASRIENYNKVYKTNFLISESTYERVRKKVDVITIKNVVIRGKASKINIYEVIRVLQN